MRNIPLRRPSAPMLVAMTALVSSFAGPAVADEVARVAQSITSSGQVKNGTITGGDIKNESVTGTDILNGSLQSDDIGTGQVQTSDIAPDSVRGDKIPNGAIGGSDIADNSLTGFDVDESSLGTVASAAKAATADSATTAGSASTAGTVGSLAPADIMTQAERLSFQRRMNKGDNSIVLDRFGAFTFHGICEDDGAGGVRARIEVTTSEENSYYEGYDSDSDFDPGESLTVVQESGTSANDENGYEIYGMYSPSRDEVIVDNDGQGTGVIINTRGADCRFASQR